MNDMPAGPLEPWSDGLLDPFYRSMLGLPEVANAGTVACMLADASQAGAPSSLPSAELNRAGAQGSLPPVIDFGVFQAAQEVEQLYSGVLPSLDEDDLLQAALPNEARTSANTKRATGRSAHVQSIPRGSEIPSPTMYSLLLLYCPKRQQILHVTTLKRLLLQVVGILQRQHEHLPCHSHAPWWRPLTRTAIHLTPQVTQTVILSSKTYLLGIQILPLPPKRGRLLGPRTAKQSCGRRIKGHRNDSEPGRR